MRGTARMKVGLNALKSARIVFRLLDRPSVTLPAKQKNCMYRANTCANGRNSSRRRFGFMAMSGMDCTPEYVMNTKLPWVNSIPLGTPVDPEV